MTGNQNNITELILHCVIKILTIPEEVEIFHYQKIIFQTNKNLKSHIEHIEQIIGAQEAYDYFPDWD